ncbi:MAG: hypothetical protein V4672_20040 [Verrucomicrobiota bacterium]
MIRQISESEFTGPRLTEGACLFRTPESLEIGQTIEWESEVEDGLGPGKFAVLVSPGGLIFSLQHYELSPRKDLMTLYVRPGDLGLHVDQALIALCLTSADLGWLADGARLPSARLIRQDDNGVQFHVGDYPCHADAEATIRHLTAGHHKQAYFIEPILKDGLTLLFPADYGGPPSVIPSP